MMKHKKNSNTPKFMQTFLAHKKSFAFATQTAHKVPELCQMYIISALAYLYDTVPLIASYYIQ